MSDNEFMDNEVPVVLTFGEWTFVSAALLVSGHPLGGELHEKVKNQVVLFSQEVHDA